MTRFRLPRKPAIFLLIFVGALLLGAGLVHFRPAAGLHRLLSREPGRQVNPDYGPAVHLADLENRSVRESSGLAASRRNAGILWTHNDSGDGPLLYAFDRQGKDRGVWRVAGATALDWEDMAAGPGPQAGRSYLYIGDIGDNGRRRDEIIVYRVAEPAVGEEPPATARRPRQTDPAEALRLRYPDGAHDAETLLVHPSTGDLYVITKEGGAPAGVYKLTAPFAASGTLTLARVGEVRLPGLLAGFLTGGDISPDGRRVILCDYGGAFELVLPEGQGAAFDAIWKEPPAPVDVGSRRQGEAVCYRADGLAILATSEQLPCPLIETPRKR